MAHETVLTFIIALMNRHIKAFLVIQKLENPVSNGQMLLTILKILKIFASQMVIIKDSRGAIIISKTRMMAIGKTATRFVPPEVKI